MWCMTDSLNNNPSRNLAKSLIKYYKPSDFAFQRLRKRYLAMDGKNFRLEVGEKETTFKCCLLAPSISQVLQNPKLLTTITHTDTCWDKSSPEQQSAHQQSLKVEVRWV